MLCALSGEPVKEPVVSPRSGAIFERKLIESYIATSGKDPVTDEPLATEDLVPVKTSVSTISPPRPPAFNSIPTMLAAFQNEWDALALETYTLRKQLNQARQELSEALYQYDAAVRVAAKAIRERDQAQTALVQLSETFANEAGGNVHVNNEEVQNGQNSQNGQKDGENDTSGNNQIPVDLLKSARDTLFALHKKQKVALPVTKKLTVQIKTSDQISTLKNIVAASASSDGSKLLLQSKYKMQILPETTTFDLKDVSAIGVINSSNGIKAIAFADGAVVDLRDNSRTDLPLTAVSTIIPHPSEALFVALTENNELALCDDNEVLYRTQLPHPVTSAALHVDGVLLGVGTSGKVKIYDLTTTEKVSSIETQYPHILKLQFALNGYWLVVSSLEGDKCALQIFDLRKNTLVHAIEFTSPIDYILDPSCLVLTTYEKSSKKLLVHLYVKKGKLWVDNAAELEAGELEYLLGESTGESVQETQVVKIAGVGKDHVVHYELSIQE